MSTVYEQFQDILKAIDGAPDAAINQELVIQQLKGVIPEGYDLTIEEKAEGLAFLFADRFTNDEDGHYFGPKIIMQRADGSLYENPSLNEVMPEMIEYWSKRATSSHHPFLTARYAGLAWDFATLFGIKPDYQLRKKFVQASIDIVGTKQFDFPSVGVQWLARALEIAIKFNDNEFFDTIRDITLEFENELNEQEKPGPWGFAYDLLINNKRINLAADQEKAIIDRLEQKLNQFSTPDKNGKTDPWACEHAVTRLAEYYKKKNQTEEVKRVVLRIGNAYKPLFESSSAFQVAGWMQSLYKIYAFHQLNEEAEALLKQLREVSNKAAQEMGGFEHQFNVPKEEMDSFVASFYTQGPNEALEQIAFRFVPDREETKQSLYELAKQAPMQFAFPIQLTDHKGRTIANVGALDDDEDGQIILGMSERLTFNNFFLHHVLEKGKENGALTKDTILTFLSNSSVIQPSRYALIGKALDYYFSDDYIGFLHVAIPQIEEAIRYLVEVGGGKTLKYRDGIYQLRTFDDVLRDEIVASVCKENMQLYFRIVFTDPRGLNYRNEICHGLMEFEMFTKQAADRVLHTLITLGMIRWDQGDTGKETLHNEN